MNGKEVQELREALNDCNNESAYKEDGVYYEIKTRIERGSYDKIWGLMYILDEALELLNKVKGSEEVTEFVKEYRDPYND